MRMQLARQLPGNCGGRSCFGPPSALLLIEKRHRTNSQCRRWPFQPRYRETLKDETTITTSRGCCLPARSRAGPGPLSGLESGEASGGVCRGRPLIPACSKWVDSALSGRSRRCRGYPRFVQKHCSVAADGRVFVFFFFTLCARALLCLFVWLVGSLFVCCLVDMAHTHSGALVECSSSGAEKRPFQLYFLHSSCVFSVGNYWGDSHVNVMFASSHDAARHNSGPLHFLSCHVFSSSGSLRYYVVILEVSGRSILHTSVSRPASCPSASAK